MHQKQEQQANTRKIERKRGGDEEESSEDRVWGRESCNSFKMRHQKMNSMKEKKDRRQHQNQSQSHETVVVAAVVGALVSYVLGQQVS